MSRYSRSIRPCSSPVRSSSHSHSRSSSPCRCDLKHDSHGRRSHGCYLLHSSCSDLCHPSSGCCLAKNLTDDSTSSGHSRHGSCSHGQVMASTCVTAWNSAPPSYSDMAAVNVCPNTLYIAGGCPPMIVSPCSQPTANVAIPCPSAACQNGPNMRASKICTSQNFSPGPSSSPQTVGLTTAASPPPSSKPMFVVVPSKQQQNSVADSSGHKGSLKPMSVSAPKASQDEVTFAIMPPGYYPYLIPTTSKKSKRKSSVKSKRSESRKSKEESTTSEETSESDESSESSSTESTSEDSSGSNT